MVNNNEGHDFTNPSITFQGNEVTNNFNLTTWRWDNDTQQSFQVPYTNRLLLHTNEYHYYNHIEQEINQGFGEHYEVQFHEEFQDSMTFSNPNIGQTDRTFFKINSNNPIAAVFGSPIEFMLLGIDLGDKLIVDQNSETGVLVDVKMDGVFNTSSGAFNQNIVPNDPHTGFENPITLSNDIQNMHFICRATSPVSNTPNRVEFRINFASPNSTFTGLNINNIIIKQASI